MKVKIYCLYDSEECKIRYIGRTTKEKIDHRLIEHITKARYFERYCPGVKFPHKVNWIRSLLKEGKEPKIKFLTEIEGWKESHIFERILIKKYKDKFDLTNCEDRGEGNKNKVFTQEQKDQISTSLKKYFEKNPIKGKRIFVYKKNGEFYKEFDETKLAAEELGLDLITVKKKVLRFSHTTKLEWQFSRIKVEKMPDLTEVDKSYSKAIRVINKYTKDEIYYTSVKRFIQYYRNLLKIKSKPTGLPYFLRLESMSLFISFHDIYINDKLYKLPS
jgi:hypothetical protein